MMQKRFLRSSGMAIPITTLSSRELNRDTNRARQAACKGPVYITDRGRPTLAEALHMPGAADVMLDPPRADWVPTPAEFR